MHGRDNDDTSAKCNPCGYNAFSRNNSDDYAVSCGAGAMQKMCLCIPEEWAASHDLRWFGGGVGKAYQLSWAGFRLDWQCYGRVIMLLDQNHSLCLRMLVLSVLIRPLSASLSLWQQLSAACSVNLKTTLCLLLSSPHITPFLTLLFSTFDCVALLQWVLTIGSCTGRVTSAGARGYSVFGKIARNMFFHPTRCNLECNYHICREVPDIAN